MSKLSKEDIYNGQKHIKKCSTSLITKEMPIRITMRYLFIHSRMATIKRTEHNVDKDAE